MKPYKRLSDFEWKLVRRAILREGSTIKAAAALYDVNAKTIANRRKAENWDGLDPLKSYEGLPTDEEILEMRSRYVVDRAMKTINEKLAQISRQIADGKHAGAQDIEALAGAAANLETKLRRRAPARTAGGVDSVRAGRKAPSVEDAIAVLDARAARRRASRGDQDDDGK